jgi:hypothetical protein
MRRRGHRIRDGHHAVPHELRIIALVPIHLDMDEVCGRKDTQPFLAA